jgi:ABC-type amino acid transport substrate-binding protein
VPASPRSALVLAALAALAFAGAATVTDSARAGNPVNVIVLREHGVGTAAAAQPYLDKFIAIAASSNGWDAASKGRYETTRAGADAFIKSDGPRFGIFSLAAFLEARGKYNVEPVGSATMATGGGQQYFMVSKTAGSLAECKGKKLATDHFDDARFIEKVVAARAFSAADFTLVTTRRFGEAGRKVSTGDADCALIDDAQLADLAKLDPGATKVAWKSLALPPMVVVAFPSAPAAEKTAFQASLPKICPQNQQVCTDVGLQTLGSASAATYDAVVKAYNAP